MWQPWRSGDKEGLAVDYYSEQFFLFYTFFFSYRCQYTGWDSVTIQEHTEAGMALSPGLYTPHTAALLSHAGSCQVSNPWLKQCACPLPLSQWLPVSQELLSLPELATDHRGRVWNQHQTWATPSRRGAGQTPWTTGCFSVSTALWMKYFVCLPPWIVHSVIVAWLTCIAAVKAVVFSSS